MSSLVNRLIPDLSGIFSRFPVPVAVCLAAFVYILIQIEDVVLISLYDSELILNGFGVAFLASGGMHLFGESRRYSKILTSFLAVIAAVQFFCLAYFVKTFATNMLFLIPALVLWVMIAGFLRKGVPFNTVWLFNAKVVTAVALAILAGSIFAGGLAAILGSMKYLFGVDFGGNAYSHIANLATVVVGPLYGLWLVPGSFDEELKVNQNSAFLQRNIPVLFNYIIVPVLLFYVVILHFYAVQIGFQWELPKGKVGLIVLFFGIIGTATWLVTKPWVDTGARFLKLFSKFWFWFTIIPACLLLVAVYQRTNAYGMTPERYGLFLIALWLVLLAAYALLEKSNAKPQIILGTMAGLLFAASFGPWGAQSVSMASQIQRIEVLLSKWGYIENARIVSNIPIGVPQKVRREIRSSISFFRLQNQLNVLEPYFAGSKSNPFGKKISNWTLVRKIEASLELNANFKANEVAVSYRHKNTFITPIGKPSVLMGPFSLYSKGEVKLGSATTVFLDDKRLRIIHDNNQYTISVHQLLLAAKNKEESVEKSLKVRLSGSRDAWLVIKTLTGLISDKREKITRFEGWLLLPPKS